MQQLRRREVRAAQQSNNVLGLRKWEAFLSSCFIMRYVRERKVFLASAGKLQRLRCRVFQFGRRFSLLELLARVPRFKS